jgi:hypothetical protein
MCYRGTDGQWLGHFCYLFFQNEKQINPVHILPPTLLYCPSMCAQVFLSPSTGFSYLNFVRIPPFPFVLHMPKLSSSIDQRVNIWWTTEITKLVSVQFSPASCYFPHFYETWFSAISQLMQGIGMHLWQKVNIIMTQFGRKLKSWVRILLKTWMSVCAFILCLCCPV